MKAVVFTLGCKVNECESDSLISGLINLGYEVSDKLEKADLYIVNTCAVTAEAEKKSRQMASRIRKLSDSAKIIFTGCAVQKDPKQFEKKSSDFLLTGVFNKNQILSMLNEKGNHVALPCDKFEELLPTKSLRTRNYVKVQDGCNNFCSYCIIPYLRGRTRSRNPKSVYEEIKSIGAKEVVINGINLSAYNYEGVNLSGLIKELKDLPCRIRLGSLEVNVIDREFLSALKELKDFAPHFHLSLQSGSNSVLKTMNRHYTAEEYLEKVNLIREYFADAGITTDIIVGFPTETDENFLETVELVKKVKFSDIHPFPFSPRSGTVASKMKDLPSEIKKQRLDVLLTLKKECKENFALKLKGKTLNFLCEEEKDGFYQGYTENYLRVYLKDKVEIGKITKVIIEEPFLDGAIAKLKGE
ncbi:MAG: tRNA (N(6)-L-threonylcarbamoyladenosine(37)-C(2))-methylthiotransferase MtaB [Clostridia bacterium]|nr:tRNA (N(6)-L-threonylcarbamoyladenosine(37)-C(2))-methylthiotransferase MtaB [Clostridia bacterium]